MKNIVIVGGSIAAVGAVQNAKRLGFPPDARIIIIEKHSHYHYMFAFPRAVVISGFEDELFVPYDKMFDSRSHGFVVQALAKQISATHVHVDRPVVLDDVATDAIPYDYLIYATGADHPAPSNLNDCDTKEQAIQALQFYQKKIEAASSVLVCGGGAAGLEVAAEIKEHFPEKTVTLVHSRERYMMPYLPSLHSRSHAILDKFGVRQILGQRVVVPPGGFVDDGKKRTVQTTGGLEIECDLQIMCTGATPNSGVLATLSPASVDPTTKYVNVKPTMQIADESFPNVFAAGDITNTTDVKAGYTAWNQGWCAIENIFKLIKRESATETDGEKKPQQGGWFACWGPPAQAKELEPLIEKKPSIPQIMLYLGVDDGASQMAMFGWVFTVGRWFIKKFFSYNVNAGRAWYWLGSELPKKENSA